jgi:hypothetical protein
MGFGELNEAYERLSRTGPEWGEDQLTNHGPMAAEVLIRRGHADMVHRWVDDYSRRLDKLPAAGEEITVRARLADLVAAATVRYLTHGHASPVVGDAEERHASRGGEGAVDGPGDAAADRDQVAFLDDGLDVEAQIRHGRPDPPDGLLDGLDAGDLGVGMVDPGLGEHVVGHGHVAGVPHLQVAPDEVLVGRHAPVNSAGALPVASASAKWLW